MHNSSSCNYIFVVAVIIDAVINIAFPVDVLVDDFANVQFKIIKDCSFDL